MADGQHISARSIAEQMLETTGKALASGDFDLFAATCHFPHVMTTMDQRIEVADRAHLKRIFDAICVKMRDRGVTELVRYIEAAKYRSATEIASTHISYTMSGSSQLEKPYPVFSILRFIDGQWKGVSSEYAVAPRSPQSNAILLSIKVDPDDGGTT